MYKLLFVLALMSIACSPRHRSGPFIARDSAPSAPARLRIINGSSGDLWIFYQIGSGGGSLPTPHQLQLAAGTHIDYPIPAEGLAATRFWAGSGCDATGNNCTIGQSGGPSNQGFTCPSYGCAPPVDSKFEGTFGCLPSVPVARCRVNPSSPTHAPLPRVDGWDTSMVDGFTLPFRVRVVGNCPGGPLHNEIDCHTISMGACPATENLSTNGAFPTLASVNMLVTNPQNSTHAGCYSDCGRLTFSQWNGMSYAPGSPQAQMYCCPTPPISPSACRAGPVASTGYTTLVHQNCRGVYAYGYDDGSGLFSCPAGVRYEVTFYGPR
jgi:hypothetical protein